MTAELHQLRFASDATFAALWGGGLLLVAGFAMWADVRRTKRKHPDKVGLMPWTSIFFVAALLGVALITLAIKGWGADSGA
jgi:hypothetical protein